MCVFSIVKSFGVEVLPEAWQNRGVTWLSGTEMTKLRTLKKRQVSECCRSRRLPTKAICSLRLFRDAHIREAPEDIEQLLLVEGDLSTKSGVAYVHTFYCRLQ